MMSDKASNFRRQHPGQKCLTAPWRPARRTAPASPIVQADGLTAPHLEQDERRSDAAPAGLSNVPDLELPLPALGA